MDFDSILTTFSQAAARRDAQRLAALFTADGCYHDGFFGTHCGRAAIAAMLERFHVGGERFIWQFLEPAASGDVGYARYCFSYISKEPESTGQLVVFDGIARLRLRDGLIADYDESFDRGLAFVQLGYSAARVHKLLLRYAAALRDSAMGREHLALRERVGA